MSDSESNSSCNSGSEEEEANDDDGFNCYYAEWISDIITNRHKPNFLFSLSNTDVTQEIIRQVLYYAERIQVDISKKLLTLEMVNLYIHKLFQHITAKFKTPQEITEASIKMLSNIKPILLITMIMLSIKSDGGERIRERTDLTKTYNIKSIFKEQKIRGLATLDLYKECEWEVFKLFGGIVPQKCLYHDISVAFVCLAKHINIPVDYLQLMDTIIDIYLYNFQSIWKNMKNYDLKCEDLHYAQRLANNRLYHAAGLIMVTLFHFRILPQIVIKDMAHDLTELENSSRKEKCRQAYRFLAYIARVTPKNVQYLAESIRIRLIKEIGE